MAITKEDLLQYKNEKEVELEKLQKEASDDLLNIDVQVESYRKSLLDEHQIYKVQPIYKVQAEIGMLDQLIKKAEDNENILS